MSLEKLSDQEQMVLFRMFEASDVMRRMYVAGVFPSQVSTAWPETARIQTDDEPHDPGEPVEKIARPTSAEISKFYECAEWISWIDDEMRRKTLTIFCSCKVRERSFSSYCKKNGWVRVSAYRRISRAIQEIHCKISKEGIFLRPPSDFWVLQHQPNSGTNNHRMAKAV